MEMLDKVITCLTYVPVFRWVTVMKSLGEGREITLVEKCKYT